MKTNGTVSIVFDETKKAPESVQDLINSLPTEVGITEIEALVAPNKLYRVSLNFDKVTPIEILPGNIRKLGKASAFNLNPKEIRSLTVKIIK